MILPVQYTALFKFKYKEQRSRRAYTVSFVRRPPRSYMLLYVA